MEIYSSRGNSTWPSQTIDGRAVYNDGISGCGRSERSRDGYLRQNGWMLMCTVRNRAVSSYQRWPWPSSRVFTQIFISPRVRPVRGGGRGGAIVSVIVSNRSYERTPLHWIADHRRNFSGFCARSFAEELVNSVLDITRPLPPVQNSRRREIRNRSAGANRFAGEVAVRYRGISRAARTIAFSPRQK